MADLVVIVPSRGRPEWARTLVQAFRNTCTADTDLVYAVDDDDPTRDEYPHGHAETGFRTSVCLDEAPQNMVHALNGAALAMVTTFEPHPFALGFMGDDHMPRTVGWDQAYLEALREMGTGIVYGNDLLQGRQLPTQVAMTADIVRALGYMAPPSLAHMYVDNFWLDLGLEAGCIRYLPDVIVEHRHPAAGKAAWDDGYLRVNSAAVYAADAQAYADWARGHLAAAVKTVQALR